MRPKTKNTPGMQFDRSRILQAGEALFFGSEIWARIIELFESKKHS